MRVTLEGHCDERGSTKYNLARGIAAPTPLGNTWSASAFPPSVSTPSALAKKTILHAGQRGVLCPKWPRPLRATEIDYFCSHGTGAGRPPSIFLAALLSTPLLGFSGDRTTGSYFCRIVDQVSRRFTNLRTRSKALASIPTNSTPIPLPEVEERTAARMRISPSGTKKATRAECPLGWLLRSHVKRLKH